MDFEAITVDLRKGENRRPEFLAINPAGKLPVLVDGDVVLTESIAIVLYLAEKYASRELIPKSLEGRANLHRWLLFAVTELEQPLWRIAKHTALYPVEQRLPAEIPLAGQDFRSMAEVLDAHMDGREYIVGDTPTVADFVMAYTLDWANEVGLLAGFPKLLSYMERMYERPNAAPRIREAFASLPA